MVRRKVKELKDMTTPELAREATKIIKTSKRQLVELEQTVAKLAAMLGVQVSLVKEEK